MRTHRDVRAEPTEGKSNASNAEGKSNWFGIAESIYIHLLRDDAQLTWLRCTSRATADTTAAGDDSRDKILATL